MMSRVNTIRHLTLKEGVKSCLKTEWLNLLYLSTLRSSTGKALLCLRPWEHFEVDVLGNVFVCCPAFLPKSIGNLYTHTIGEVWNSRSARAIRKSILKGSFKYCRRYCPIFQLKPLPTYDDVSATLEKGTPSTYGFLRLKPLPAYDDISAPSEKGTPSTYGIELKKGPTHLNISYDPTCNLQCYSCRRRVKSLTREEQDRARSLQDKVIEDSFLKNLRTLRIAGQGDPFASRLYRELLQEFDFSIFPQLKLLLLTNGLLLTPEMWMSLHKSSQNSIFEIAVSVDAANQQTYHLLRRGGDFDQLMRNLTFISELRKNGSIGRFILNFVVQKANYNEMKSFVELGKNLGCDQIYFTPIRNWGTYTRREFSEVAVHKKIHPDHKKLLKCMSDPIFKDPIVSSSHIQTLQRG